MITTDKRRKFKYEDALLIAQSVKNELEPHCRRVEIVGSIRRRLPMVKDIDMICIPKPFDYGLFESGVAKVVNQWKKIKGNMNHSCKSTQRMLPQGIMLDLNIVTEENWGYMLATRTGSENFSKHLASSWVKNGYKGEDGYLTFNGARVWVYEEEELFDYAGVEYIEPWERK